MKLLGVNIFSGTKKRALDKVEAWLKTSKKHLIFTPNPEQLVQAHHDHSFKKILNRGDLNLPDGIGLVWFSKLQHKISGADFMLDLCQLAAKKHLKVGLLGAKRGVADKAGWIIKEKYGSKIVFAQSGLDNIDNISPAENTRLIKRINQTKPDILLVAFGAPRQETWLYNSLEKLNIQIGMVVGGAFDQLADPTLKPPKWLGKLGLGWFYRLLRQPWRIKRQLRLIEFIWLVFS